MANEIEKEYSKLSKKYKLPKFKEIDSEFEISNLENERFLIKNILRRMAERLDASSISTMYELRFFTENEKNNMYVLFKKMMKANRGIIEVVLINEEKKEAEFLANFFHEWQGMKKGLVSYITQMKESWGKESTIEEDVGYLG